jgi:DNA segregation ATPase FtsK/SpoIIIE-like protein
MNEDKELNFASCQIDKYKFDMKEGGSVEIAFRVIAHPTAEDVGELYELLGDTVNLTLTPPDQDDEEEAPEQAGMFEQQADPEEEPGEGDHEAEEIGEAHAAEKLYEQAVDIVRATKAARSDYIRRKMKISVAQANEFIDRMEAQGIVTAADHSGQRAVIEDAA